MYADLLIAPLVWFASGFVIGSVETNDPGAGVSLGIAFAVMGLLLAGVVRATKSPLLLAILWLGPIVLTLLFVTIF